MTFSHRGRRNFIELHAFDTPNGRKISVALEEMALPYTVTVVDIRKGRQFDPAFLKISPNGKIPAIVDPDGPNGKPVSVFENRARSSSISAKRPANSGRETWRRAFRFWNG